MPKATKPVIRPRSGRKARAPFTLNSEARRLLRAHEKLEASEQAFRAAAAAEKAAGRNVDKHDYTPATVALGQEWRDGMKRLEAMGDALADRAAKKRNPALADCLTLAVAGWHSRRADRECVRAVLAVAGIDLTGNNR